MPGIRRHALRIALTGALLACAWALPSAAPANVATAVAPTLGTTALTIPADGHQVYRVSVAANDWVIGYAWVPGTRDAAATIRVLEPSASDVASSAVATSSAAGVLFYQAPAAGTCLVDFSAAPGTVITRGLFLSRPTLTAASGSVVTVPYNGTFTAACSLRDELYRYVAYDGPVVAFENVALKVSRSGQTPTVVWRGSTDLTGKARRPIKGITRTLQFSFEFPGSVSDAAGFGTASTRVVTVIPRVRLTIRAPKSARHGRGFRVAGMVQPWAPAGAASTSIEAHKKGSRKIFHFQMTAAAPKHGANVLGGTVVLPSAGKWYVRLHRPTGSGYLDTTTKWVAIGVR